MIISVKEQIYFVRKPFIKVGQKKLLLFFISQLNFFENLQVQRVQVGLAFPATTVTNAKA